MAQIIDVTLFELSTKTAYRGAYELRYLNFMRDYPGKGGDWWDSSEM